MSSSNKKRGAYRRKDCVFIGAWLPADWVDGIDQLVAVDDSDRSKVIRRAIREKLAAMGRIGSR